MWNLLIVALLTRYIVDSVFILCFRKILNDLSGQEVAPRNEADEDISASSAMTTVSLSTPIIQTSSGQYSKLTSTYIEAQALPCRHIPSCVWKNSHRALTLTRLNIWRRNLNSINICKWFVKLNNFFCVFCWFQLQFRPTVCLVLGQRQSKACKRSPWPIPIQTSRLYSSMPRLLMDSRFYYPAIRWCFKVGLNTQNTGFIYTYTGSRCA